MHKFIKKLLIGTIFSLMAATTSTAFLIGCSKSTPEQIGIYFYGTPDKVFGYTSETIQTTPPIILSTNSNDDLNVNNQCTFSYIIPDGHTLPSGITFDTHNGTFGGCALAPALIHDVELEAVYNGVTCASGGFDIEIAESTISFAHALENVIGIVGSDVCNIEPEIHLNQNITDISDDCTFALFDSNDEPFSISQYGLNFNSNTGYISGQPNTAMNFEDVKMVATYIQSTNVILRATETFRILISDAPEILFNSNPANINGYSQIDCSSQAPDIVLNVDGSHVGSYCQFELLQYGSDFEFSNGLSFNSESGVISGTPNAEGTITNLTIRASYTYEDSTLTATSAPFSVIITASSIQFHTLPQNINSRVGNQVNTTKPVIYLNNSEEDINKDDECSFELVYNDQAYILPNGLYFNETVGIIYGTVGEMETPYVRNGIRIIATYIDFGITVESSFDIRIDDAPTIQITTVMSNIESYTGKQISTSAPVVIFNVTNTNVNTNNNCSFQIVDSQGNTPTLPSNLQFHSNNGTFSGSVSQTQTLSNLHLIVTYLYNSSLLTDESSSFNIIINQSAITFTVPPSNVNAWVGESFYGDIPVVYLNAENKNLDDCMFSLTYGGQSLDLSNYGLEFENYSGRISGYATTTENFSGVIMTATYNYGGSSLTTSATFNIKINPPRAIVFEHAIENITVYTDPSATEPLYFKLPKVIYNVDNQDVSSACNYNIVDKTDEPASGVYFNRDLAQFEIWPSTACNLTDLVIRVWYELDDNGYIECFSNPFSITIIYTYVRFSEQPSSLEVSQGTLEHGKPLLVENNNDNTKISTDKSSFQFVGLTDTDVYDFVAEGLMGFVLYEKDYWVIYCNFGKNQFTTERIYTLQILATCKVFNYQGQEETYTVMSNTFTLTIK